MSIPSSSAGFTLVELLVAMAIGVIIIGLAGQLMQSSGKITQQSVVNSEGIQNTQQAANIMADDFRRAITVFRPNQSVVLGSIATTAPATTGNNLIMFYTNRIYSDCSTKYEFYAYYLALRSGFTAIPTSTNEWAVVNPDSANNDKYVLVQFKACSDQNTTTSFALTNQKIRLVTDYLISGNFTYATVNPRSLTLSLQAGQTRGSTVIKGNTINTTTIARNLY